MNWLVDDASFGLFTFSELTRAITRRRSRCRSTAATAIFSTGSCAASGSTAVQLLPPLPWIAVVGVARGARLSLRRQAARAPRRAARFSTSRCSASGQSAMLTLASIAIAVPLGVAGGAAARHRRLPRAARRAAIMAPILDLMQTVPIFAYLVPILFLFGFGPVAALIATIIYAMPPMVRVTMLGASRPCRTRSSSSARMAGCTRRQMLLAR